MSNLLKATDLYFAGNNNVKPTSVKACKGIISSSFIDDKLSCIPRMLEVFQVNENGSIMTLSIVGWISGGVWLSVAGFTVLMIKRINDILLLNSVQMWWTSTPQLSSQISHLQISNFHNFLFFHILEEYLLLRIYKDIKIKLYSNDLRNQHD